MRGKGVCLDKSDVIAENFIRVRGGRTCYRLILETRDTRGEEMAAPDYPRR